MAEETETENCYAVINNIPQSYHSVDLRNYFSELVETGSFDCFHFRHRPERQITENNSEKPKSSSGSDNVNDFINKNESSKTTCCVIRLKRRHHFDEMIKVYKNKNWSDKNGDTLSSVCHISEINVSKFILNKNGTTNYQTKLERKQIPEDRVVFTESDLLKLPELHPPEMMPHGNIGTPTKTFLSYISECRLPPKIIKKLGLSFPRTKPKKLFGTVPYDYGDDYVAFQSSFDSGVDDCDKNSGRLKFKNNLTTTISKPGASGALPTNKTDSFCEEEANQNHDRLTILSHISSDRKSLDKQAEQFVKISDSTVLGNTSLSNHADYKRKREAKKAERKRISNLKAENIEEKMIGDHSGSEEDGDGCEEWERHEAHHDDVSNQARNSERLFEDKIELKWEKGGSGLVFYTDAQYWKKFEGDFDEQCADDWDVDTSCYYEDGAGDMDSKDLLTMRLEKRRRDGIENTDRYIEGKIGKFERYTKGVGRKIMEQQGWTDGNGLGTSSNSGIINALENDGQNPKNKKGLGFCGAKINTFRPSVRRVSKMAKNDHLITTIYDDPEVTDPSEPLLRRNEPYIIKHTPGVSHIEFTKSSVS